MKIILSLSTRLDLTRLEDESRDETRRDERGSRLSANLTRRSQAAAPWPPPPQVGALAGVSIKFAQRPPAE